MSTSIEILSSNCIKVWVGGRKAVLFSYTTPIAAWLQGDGEIRRYAVRERYSVTTSKHLRSFGPEATLRPGDHFETVSAAELDRLLADE